MKNFAIILVAFMALALGGRTAASEPPAGQCSLLYTETVGDDSTQKEYTITQSPGGYEIGIAIGNIRRTIRTDNNLATVSESYWNTENSDRVDVDRQDNEMVFQGRVDGETIHETKDIEDKVWFGSVLLLKEFVLSGDDAILFYVTKPEEEKAVLIKGIREKKETVTVNNRDVEAVKIKFTVPDIRGLFWKSYYWYRLDDGLLVKTKETRGPPGTPKARVELVKEPPSDECCYLAGAKNGQASVAER